MARYEGWRALSGDTDRQDLLDYGKKLLGYLAEQRRLSGVKTMQVIRQTPDGSVVRARFAYDIPIIEAIAAAPPPLPGTEELPSGFVVTPRNTERPGGLDATFPQEILKPSWTPFCYTTAIGALTGVENVGVYRPKFPDGIRHGANQDWCNADGVRVNWYGPSRRYWFDTYRTPAGQYAGFVFLNGSPLLDIAAFFADDPIAEGYVLGAAYSDGWLYVMQAAIADFPTTPSIPDRTGWPAGRAGGFTVPYPDGDSSLALYRYRVLLNPAPTGNADLFSVADAELLWSHTGRGWVNPWFFNPDVTVCECFAMPDELRAFRWASNTTTPATVVDLSPSTSSEHCVLSIDGASVTAAFDDRSVAWGSFGSLTNCEIAADYAIDGTRIPLVLYRGEYDFPFPAPPNTYVYSYTEIKIGSADPYPLSFWRTGVGTDPSEDMSGQGGELLAIDLRTGVLVLLRHIFELQDIKALEVAIYQGGVPVHREQLCLGYYGGWNNWMDNWNDQVGRYGDTDPTHPLGGTMVSPLFKVCGIAGDFSYTSASNTFSRYGVPAGVGRHWMLNPVGERRGALRLNRASTTFNLNMSSDVSHFPLDATDTDGHAVQASLAVDKKGRFVASVAGYFPWSDTSKGVFYGGWSDTGALQYRTVNFISGGVLPAVTGIASDGARFSPIWQLSQWPKTT